MSNNAKQQHIQAVEKIKQFVAYAAEAQDARLHAMAWRMSRRLDGRRAVDWGNLNPGTIGPMPSPDTVCGAFSIMFTAGTAMEPAHFYVWDDREDEHVASFYVRGQATAQLQAEELNRVHALAVSVAQSLDSAKSAG